MATTSSESFLTTAVFLIAIQVATCQCDWNTDGFAYQNVKDNSAGFLEWNLVYGPLPEGELGPQAGYDGGDDCYFVARGGSDGYQALLLSPCYVTPQTSTDIVDVSFALHSFGPNAGSLNMYWRPGCLEPRDLPDESIGTVGITIANSLSNQWLSLNPKIDMNQMPMNMPFQIIFEAVMKGEGNNSISIDNIVINNANTLTTAIPAEATTVQPEVATSMNVSHQTVTMDSQTSFVNLTSAASNGSDPANVTLNFCEANLVIEGVDNCTFIGLMFAVVPLVLICIVWAVCRTYNRFCRTFDKPKRRKHDDEENSLTKDMYASNSNLYLNSMTENTLIFAPASPGNTRAGVSAETSNHEMNRLHEGKEQHIGDNGNKKKSASPVMPHKYEKRKSHLGEFLTVPKNVYGVNVVTPPGGVGEHAYNVPEGPKPDHPYDVVDESPTEGDQNQNELTDSIATSPTYQVPSENQKSPVSSSEAAPHYDILDEPTTPPTPPNSQRPSQRNKNSFIEAYASVAVDDSSLLIPSPTEQDPPQILHYADSFVGRNRDNKDSLNNSPTCNTYEELNKKMYVDGEVCTDKEATDAKDVPAYLTPRSSVRATGSTVLDNEGNEDTFL